MAKENPYIGDGGKADLSHLKKINIGQKAIKSVSAGNSVYKDWPLTKYSFEISIGGFTGSVAFQAMDGLGAEIATMKFRDGNSGKFYEQSRPTLTSYSPVTLKKGVFVGDKTLFNWFTNVSNGTFFSDMRTVTIHLSELSGDKHNHIFTWTLEQAYVTKFTPSNLDAEADTEVALEEVEITYQSFSMEAGLLSSILGAASSLIGGISF
ncbi:phage tail protein [Aureispira anguillae]|uniref:Phage tail protein n=1 Tax=Aureispira anguillae TaxID=2864201 RepID=A0A915YJ73_9BACT|nr:phage tail protein [Aureispira anguillae]BDS13999.1 phage tail protein [Aureispira anguillae]